MANEPQKATTTMASKNTEKTKNARETRNTIDEALAMLDNARNQLLRAEETLDLNDMLQSSNPRYRHLMAARRAITIAMSAAHAAR